MPKNDRSIRGNRRGRAANICDRSGSSVDEWFAGWKASPSCWKDAGEAEWWRHGRCGQVARKDAAGRSPVHPFAPLPPAAPLATDLYTYICMPVFRNTYTHMWTLRGSLLPLFGVIVPRPFSPPSVSRCIPPLSLHRIVSALDPNASAVLTKLPVFVLREIAGYHDN